jgi:multicomponent Na+:H+ antiporter subunit B
MLLIGLYVVAHGHLTPGGGFQGGVILASGWVLIYLADELKTFRRLTPEGVVEAAEALAAGAYVFVGAGGLLAGREFLANVLPFGQPGSLLSAGTILLLNLGVGVEVGAAFVLLSAEFLRQVLEMRERR